MLNGEIVWDGSTAGPKNRTRPTPQNGPTPPQYAVVFVNEEQLGQLLQQQSMRNVTPRLLPAGGGFASYTRLMRRARIAIVGLAVLIAGASAWAFVPLPMFSALPWTRTGAAPTIATGASFSLAVGAPRSARNAAELAGRLMSAGIPAFSHAVPDRHAHQVLVGPYVSLDEAEAQQRRLAAKGFGTARMVVDETLRHAPRSAVVAEAPGHPGLVLVGAPGRLSLALEMRAEPRRVSVTRPDPTTLAVTVGPVDVAVDSREWSAPQGAHLIRSVAIDEVAEEGSPSYARATLRVPEFTRVNTRVEGRRVYIDLTWPREAGAADPIRAPRAPAVASAAPARTSTAAPAAASATNGAPKAEPLDPLAPVVARFERMLPFVQSAARAPAPDVLAALAPMVDEVDASLRQMPQAGDAQAARGLLISAAAAARRAIAADFAGDRVAEAHQATGLFEAAGALITN